MGPSVTLFYYFFFFFSELSIMASRQSRHMKTMSWKVILWMDKSRPLVQQIMPKLYEIITDCSKCHMNWDYCKTRYMLQKRCLKLIFFGHISLWKCVNIFHQFLRQKTQFDGWLIVFIKIHFWNSRPYFVWIRIFFVFVRDFNFHRKMCPNWVSNTL